MIISSCIHYPANHVPLFFLKAENDSAVYLPRFSYPFLYCWRLVLLHNLAIDLPHILKKATEALEKIK